MSDGTFSNVEDEYGIISHNIYNVQLYISRILCNCGYHFI